MLPAWPNNTTALCQKDCVLNTFNYQMNTASEKVKQVLPLFDILKLWWWWDLKNSYLQLWAHLLKCYVYQISTFAHENNNIFVIQRRIEQGEDESSYEDPPPSHYQYLYVCVLADSSWKRDNGEGLHHRLNVELDIQSLFGPHVHSCTHWPIPRTPPPPHSGSYTRGAIGQPR